MAKIYIMIHFLISVDTIYSDIDMNIKKASEKTAKNAHNGCLYLQTSEN